MSRFEILNESGKARRARLSLAHGTLETPVFMPVGTYGAVKTLTPEDLKRLNTQIILGNTYHLYIRPGLEVLRTFGGLHRFMNWDRPILTDSGGFQVFSLGKLKKVTDEGVEFKNHLNGDRIFLTPELSAEIQSIIGSDIAMAFDECVALPAERDVVESAVNRSLRWGERFFKVPAREGQLRFGIVQGGTSPDLRMRSLEGTLAFPLDGLAVGGLSVGEPHEIMIETLAGLSPHLPKKLPHYLMGVGTPLDLLEAVAQGIDMFDCVLPTRNARNGYFFTSQGGLNIRNAEHTLSELPIDPGCGCECCQSYSRSYLRHLFQTKEILGCRLATLHNVHYYHALMSAIRDAIGRGDFPAFYAETRVRFREFYLKERFHEVHNPAH